MVAGALYFITPKKQQCEVSSSKIIDFVLLQNNLNADELAQFIENELPSMKSMKNGTDQQWYELSLQNEKSNKVLAQGDDTNKKNSNFDYSSSTQQNYKINDSKYALNKDLIRYLSTTQQLEIILRQKLKLIGFKEFSISQKQNSRIPKIKSSNQEKGSLIQHSSALRHISSYFNTYYFKMNGFNNMFNPENKEVDQNSKMNQNLQTKNQNSLANEDTNFPFMRFLQFVIMAWNQRHKFLMNCLQRFHHSFSMKIIECFEQQRAQSNLLLAQDILNSQLQSFIKHQDHRAPSSQVYTLNDQGLERQSQQMPEKLIDTHQLAIKQANQYHQVSDKQKIPDRTTKQQQNDNEKPNNKGLESKTQKQPSNDQSQEKQQKQATIIKSNYIHPIRPDSYSYSYSKIQHENQETQESASQKQPTSKEQLIELMSHQIIETSLRSSLQSIGSLSFINYDNFFQKQNRKYQKSLCEQLELVQKQVQLIVNHILRKKQVKRNKECPDLSYNLYISLYQQLCNYVLGQYKKTRRLRLKYAAELLDKPTFDFLINLSIRAQQKQITNSSIKSQQHQYPIQDYIRCTGLIQCIWYDRFGRVQMVGYATAFAISEKIILTCAHSIYEKKRARACDKIYFIPFHGDSSYTTRTDVYQSEDENFLKFQPLLTNERYGNKPLAKDYAVFVIKRLFVNKCYLQLCDQKPRDQQPLQIWGFPSKQYMISTPIVGTNFKREDLEGHFVQIKKKHILVHSMPTQGGHSGSPILRLTDNRNKPSIKVVGIHTHRGNNNTNQGVLITKQLKVKIMRFSKQLCTEHNLKFQQLFPDEKSTLC